MSSEQLLQQAKSFQQAGQLREATAAFEKLRSLYPRYPPILNDLAILYLQQSQFIKGAQLLEYSLKLDPKQPEALYNLGKAYQDQNKLIEACNAYKKVTEIQPRFVDAYFNRGICLDSLERFREAIECFDYVINTHPDATHALNAKGASLYHAGDYSNALSLFERSLELNQESSEIYNNIGLALHKLNRFEEALSYYDKALEVAPHYAAVYSNRGLTLQSMQKTNQALEDYNKCLEIDPNNPDAHWNKALVNIQMGNFEEGWPLYEWRWKSFSKKWARQYQQPLWLGEQSLKGKSILIYPEQGYGDFIQFYRYIPKLQALGARVILETPAPLISLITESSTEVEIVESGKKLPKFDFQCPIMSLPLAFKTNLDSIPNKFPYLKASPEKIKAWQEKLGVKTKPRIGLAWSGSTLHKNDHNRSLHLETLLPLLELPLEFHSLQKEIREQDQIMFNQVSIQNHQQDLKDFADTAALIEMMDAVISVDTSVAHLTGALNKTFFLLLPFNVDYRWMLGREESPWYQSATLLRQAKSDGWADVIEKLKISIDS